jgi:tRNA-dihydrouridine synthase 3
VNPFDGKLWLAPLTFGGNLPFRRLCVEFGAEVTVGEMAVVRKLLQRRQAEYALLRSHPSETMFGAQLADRDEGTLAEGARIAAGKGARFIDLNCGCPIFEFTRRGLGSGLMLKPRKIAGLVAAMKAAVDVPVTVKLRLGYSDDKRNVSEVARLAEEAGASAITIHGRTREARYSKAADWDAIGAVAAERSVPVVGNGDILTCYEARDRMARAGVRSVMLARGALIKPWLFREIHEDRTWLPTPVERLGVLWAFLGLLLEHFGADERGRTRVRQFLSWHLGFFHRYRPLPEEDHLEASRAHPLLQTRQDLGEGLEPLEALLRDARPAVHERLADALLWSASFAEAVERAGAVDRSGDAPTGDERDSEPSARLIAG